MSKRSAQRHRQEKRIREGERHLSTLEVKELDAVTEIVERAKVKEGQSRQPRFEEPAGIFMSVVRWALSSIAKEPGPRATMREWDAWYRASVKQEPFLSSVFNGVVQIDVNRGWSITGGKRQVKTFTDTLKGVDRWIRVGNEYVEGNTGGWRAFSSWQAQSYYATQMGFVSEIGRSGRNGPLFTLWSVDPCRCELSGNPAAPLWYYPATGGSGKQEWEYDAFIRKCSLISTDETQLGYGFPAVARCYQLAKVMVGVLSHYQQKLGSKKPDAIITGNNMSQAQWETAVESRNETLLADPDAYLNSVATIMSSGPEMPEFVVTLLSNLPDQWDIELWTRILMRGYESAFGYKGEFTYENAGVLGRGNEVQTQHRNATAMGGKDFILANQGEIQNILPPTIEFLYDERDVEGEIEEANLQRAKADVITSISNWVEVSPAGQQSRIPTAQLLQLAAENDVVPDDWAVGEEDVTATDEEEVEQPNELSERVQRAMQAFPDEPIVRYEWPRDRTRIVRVPRRRSFYFPKVLHRSVGEVVKSYEDSLTNLVYNAWNRIGNKLTAPAVMQTAFRTEHKRLVNRVGPEAYGEGLREGGVAIEEMDASDKTAISEWVSAQASFVNDFARAVVEAGADEAQRPAILTRLAQWVRSASDLGNTGYLSTKKNRPAIWHLGPTETHCKTCVGLDGKRHRVSWFLERGYLPHVPGNTVLACNGYGHCFISDAVTGERIEV